MGRALAEFMVKHVVHALLQTLPTVPAPCCTCRDIDGVRPYEVTFWEIVVKFPSNTLFFNHEVVLEPFFILQHWHFVTFKLAWKLTSLHSKTLLSQF